MKTFTGLALSLLAAGLLQAGQRSLPEPQMTYLDNGRVRIGMDLALGGAVTFLSSKDHPGNLINSADLGRQIQMSHYSGPWPFEPGGKKPRPEWAGLGWNPIQTGDCFMNPSKVLEHRNDGKELYIKCVPMQWPLNNVPGDCLFETWTTLEGPVVHMRYRCTNQRSDKTAYHACPQELPAVYTISKLSRLMSYTGSKPFTGDAASHMTNDFRKPWPWTRFLATEGWAALVNEDGWGLGVFKQGGGEFHGGIYGTGRTDDPKDGSTAYVAPIHREIFDHNIVYEHRTEFMVGTLSEIRKEFNEIAMKDLPTWTFKRDRQHWILQNATDAGFPLNGEWRVQFGRGKTGIESPPQFWRAEKAPGVMFEIAGNGKRCNVRVLWRRLGQEAFDQKQSMNLALSADSSFHQHTLNLGSSPEYRDLITGLRLEPADAGEEAPVIRIKSVRLSAKGN